jgi:hypothetical protein
MPTGNETRNMVRNVRTRYELVDRGPAERPAPASGPTGAAGKRTLRPIDARTLRGALFVHHDERDGVVLIGRQRDGRLLRVHQMSDGTREQLFFALRLTAIERYVGTSGPVPVVLDDVFLESDEPRSERIFEASVSLPERRKWSSYPITTTSSSLADISSATAWPPTNSPTSHRSCTPPAPTSRSRWRRSPHNGANPPEKRHYFEPRDGTPATPATQSR